MKNPLSKEFWQLDHLRTTWEYKSVAFLLRATLALSVVMYVFMTAPAAWPGLKIAHARSQPAHLLEGLIEDGLKNDDLSWANLWLTARPGKEAAQHSAIIEKHIGNLPAPFITTMIRNSRLNNDQAQIEFWLMYMQYRMRFDIARCGIPELSDKYTQLYAMALAMSGEKDDLAEVKNQPRKMSALLHKILDYDAKNPMRNSPKLTCEMMAGLVRNATPDIYPEQTWATVRHTLRTITEGGIMELNQTP